MLGLILEWVPEIRPFTGGGPSAFRGGAEKGQIFFLEVTKNVARAQGEGVRKLSVQFGLPRGLLKAKKAERAKCLAECAARKEGKEGLPTWAKTPPRYKLPAYLA